MNAFTRYFEKKVEVYKKVREVTTHPALIRECERMIDFYSGGDSEMYLGAEMGDWRGTREGGTDGNAARGL